MTISLLLSSPLIHRSPRPSPAVVVRFAATKAGYRFSIYPRYRYRGARFTLSYRSMPPAQTISIDRCRPLKLSASIDATPKQSIVFHLIPSMVQTQTIDGIEESQSISNRKWAKNGKNNNAGLDPPTYNTRNMP